MQSLTGRRWAFGACAELPTGLMTNGPESAALDQAVPVTSARRIDSTRDDPSGAIDTP
jgi:hypothetical protein